MIALLLALIAGEPAVTASSTPEVWIEHTQRDGLVDLVGYARSSDTRSVDFVLDVSRLSRGNISRTRQGGSVQLNAADAVRLSATTIGPISTPDEWRARLTISDNGNVLAAAEAPSTDLPPST